MDGKGRWVDNGFVERLWWSVKYEEVYMKAYASPQKAHQHNNAQSVFDFITRYVGPFELTHLRQGPGGLGEIGLKPAIGMSGP